VPSVPRRPPDAPRLSGALLSPASCIPVGRSAKTGSLKTARRCPCAVTAPSVSRLQLIDLIGLLAVCARDDERSEEVGSLATTAAARPTIGRLRAGQLVGPLGARRAEVAVFYRVDSATLTAEQPVHVPHHVLTIGTRNTSATLPIPGVAVRRRTRLSPDSGSDVTWKGRPRPERPSPLSRRFAPTALSQPSCDQLPDYSHCPQNWDAVNGPPGGAGRRVKPACPV
jgi:hypothetical protein